MADETGLTQVDATIEEIVSAKVQDVLTSKLVVVPTVMDFSSQVGPGMDRVKIPRFGNFVVATKVSGTPLTNQTQTFATDDLLLDQHKAILVTIEDIAELQAKINVTNEFINQSGRDLAAQMDQFLITQMEGSASAAAPDHIIAFDTAPNLNKADILAARALLNEANVALEDRFALLKPDQESSLMSISEFTRVDESGGSGALRNGMIGKLFGFDVIVSSQVGSDANLFYQRSTHAFARQLAPRTQSDLDLENVGRKWLLDHIFGTKGLDQGKRIVKVNTTGA